MTNLLLVVAMIATLAASFRLALEGIAVLALPLVIIFAGLSGITPAEIALPPHDDRQL